MKWWNRCLEALDPRSLKGRARRASNESADDTAVVALLKEKIAELEAQKQIRGKREESLDRQKERVEKLKSQVQELKDQIARFRSTIKGKDAELTQLRHEVWLEQTRNAAYGAAGLLHPGRPAPIPPDEEVERRYDEFLRLAKKVWSGPMRLGVLHQYGARPLAVEKLPRVSVTGDFPTVSVATPSYNQAEFLEKTLLSVIGQDYPRLEYFVFDGGSKDGSVAILEKHAAKLTYWASELDRGAAHAINKGLAKGTGDIMAWLNSDDLWTSGNIACVASYFASHPQVDVVYGNRLIIDEKGNQVGHWTLPRHDDQMLLWSDYVPQETLFWRRSIWEKVGGALDETFQFAFDWDLLLRFQRAGARIERLPWFLGCFRAHAAQKSTADALSVGAPEIAQLRARELGSAFNERGLELMVMHYQRRAMKCERLRKWGIRR